MKLPILSLILSAAMFSACAQNQISNHTAFIRIISPKIKLASSAIISKSKNEVLAQLYSQASVVAVLKANISQVCLNDKCLSNQTFNKRFLGINTDESIVLKMLLLKRLDLLDYKDKTNIHKYFNSSASAVILDNSLSFKSKTALFDIRYLN